MSRSTLRSIVLVLLAALLGACAGDAGDATKAAAGGAPSTSTAGLEATEGSREGSETSVTAPVEEPKGTPAGTGDGPTSPSGSPGQSGGGTATTTAAGPYRGELGVTNDSIAIGLFYSKTGPIAALSNNVAAAVDAAFAEANEKGGINGRKVIAKAYDDGSYTPSVVQSSWERAKDSIFASLVISGELFLPFAERDRLPLLHGTTQEGPSVRSKYGFIYFPYVEYQARALMPDYLLNRLNAKGKKVAVIYSDQNATAAADPQFVKAAKQKGLDIVINQPVPDQPSSCVNEVSNVQAKRPDIVVLLAYPFAAICVLRDARTLNFKPVWTSVAVTFNLGVVNVGSGGATEGITLMGHMRTLETDCGERFRAAARKYTPDKASSMAQDELAYNYYLIARRMIEQLKRTPKNLTRESFVTGSQGGTIDDGCLSPVSYANGDRQGPRGVNLTQARGEKWITVDPTWRTSF